MNSSVARQAAVKRARLITVAWGESYLQELLDFTLPAVLAPGNLPALAAELECDVVLLTETRLFGRVREHPVFERIGRHCPVRLVGIDDLVVAPLYGLALTWAVYRGFEDLGERVTETALVFVWSDWIPADGSYRALLGRLRAGARLINSPSYCVVAERAAPDIRARMAGGNGVLSIPHREMAQLAIRHRHNTIRGKTVNRRLFHMNVIDQFYWLVDAHTLLAHQMPIAVACMVPERFRTEPECFWDYGITLELCPTTKPLVLADSDEFLMIELRSEATYSEGLRIGWPSLEQVGRQLATFITKDHLDFSAYQLCLHSRDLPPQLEEAREKLRTAVAAAVAEIRQPHSYKRHHYWWPQRALFDVVRRDFASGEIVSQWRWGFRASPYTNIVLAEMDKVEQAAQQKREAGVAVNLASELEPLGGCIGQLEGLFISDLNALRKAYRAKLQRWDAPLQTRSQAGTAADAPTEPVRPLRAALSRLRDFLNRPHPWHPDRVAASHLLHELARRPTAERANAAVICSNGRDLAARLFRMRGIRPKVVAVETASTAIRDRSRLAVLDLDQGDLSSFRPLCRMLLPMIEDGGAILLLHENRRGPLGMDPWTMLNVFPPSDQVTVKYAGSRWSHLATGIYDRARRVLPRIMLGGFNISAVAALAASAPAALLAAIKARLQPPDEIPPPSCASMLLVLPVNPAVRKELERW